MLNELLMWQGIWGGMIFGGTAVQTVILAIITVRRDWEKEVLFLNLRHAYTCCMFYVIIYFFLIERGRKGHYYMNEPISFVPGFLQAENARVRINKWSTPSPED